MHECEVRRVVVAVGRRHQDPDGAHGAVGVFHETGTTTVAVKAVHARLDDVALLAFDDAAGLTGDRPEFAERHAYLNLREAQHIPDRIPATDITRRRADARVHPDNRGVPRVAHLLACGDHPERIILPVS